MVTNYSWDTKTQRYRQRNADGSLGSFVSRKQINQLSERHLETYKPELRAIAQDLIDGKNGLAAWELKTAEKLKQGHIQSWALGRGGVDRLTSRDYGLIGARVKEQYIYLRRFAQSIRSGELTEAQILARVELYAEALYPTQQAAQTEGHKQNGFDWERNILSPGENCVGCQAESSKGWQPIGSGVPIGSRNCLVRCRCHWEYNHGTEKPTESILNRSWGWHSRSTRELIAPTLSSLL